MNERLNEYVTGAGDDRVLITILLLNYRNDTCIIRAQDTKLLQEG